MEIRKELYPQCARFYLCGNGKHMAPGVHETLFRIYREEVGGTTAEAEAWVEKVERKQGWFAADIFA